MNNGVSQRPAGIPTQLKLGDIIYDEVFQYSTVMSFTVALGTLVTTIPIQSDAHFIWVAGVMNSNAASGAGTFQGAGVNRGGALIQVTDGSTNRQLSNVQVPANCLFGSAQRPFVLPLRKLFKANSPIGINATDTTNTTTQVIDFVFCGFKVPLAHWAMLAPLFGTV
jgi:hypothetical protein